MLEQKAYAKINLGLDVLGVLPNGYHEVKMIMQTVGICDTLTFEKIPAGIEITTDNGELPCNEDNLIYKAAKALMEKKDVKEGVRIHLEKQIPIAAGMAGGSSDAAATLKGVNALYELGLSEEELREVGVKIGADVPYCILGGTALAEGIGEKLTKLSPAPNCFLCVAKPEVGVSTKYVYEHLDAKPIQQHPDIDGMLDAIAKDDLQGVTSRLGNVLEPVTKEVHPIVGELEEIMLANGALGSIMSGSGPTVFGMFDEEKKAEAAFNEIQEKRKANQCFLTKFVSAKEVEEK